MCVVHVRDSDGLRLLCPRPEPNGARRTPPEQARRVAGRACRPQYSPPGQSRPSPRRNQRGRLRVRLMRWRPLMGDRLPACACRRPRCSEELRGSRPHSLVPLIRARPAPLGHPGSSVKRGARAAPASSLPPVSSLCPGQIYTCTWNERDFEPSLWSPLSLSPTGRAPPPPAPRRRRCRRRRAPARAGPPAHTLRGPTLSTKPSQARTFFRNSLVRPITPAGPTTCA